MTHYPKYTTIAEIADNTNFELNDIDYDVSHILESIGKPELIEEYPILYVKVKDADFHIIYGCTNNIPYLSEDLTKIWDKSNYDRSLKRQFKRQEQQAIFKTKELLK